ncbi:P-loop ATPase, Sll1717 family [Ekhidna sp.]|uniref:P-loop ATPase, Sll1717 family n=1 Tax=Ekhidna sp. TaxID=2608089 RepID=UPI003BAB8BA0
MKWASDASQMDIDNLPELIYKTTQIEQFITDHRKYFIAGNKGMGKTLLLSIKRHQLSSTYSEEGSRKIMFIPQNEPFLDFMSGIMDMGKSNAFLEKRDEVRLLWKNCIMISILSHFDVNFSTNEREIIIKHSPNIIGEWMMSKSKVNPSLIFQELLRSLDLSRLIRFLKSVDNILQLKISNIHSAVFVFIDKIDQAMASLSKSSWIHVQCGLLEAIWDIVESNKHVKIYASIRQEAFGNFTNKQIQSNIYNHTTQLQYYKEDLIGIMNKLSKVYENLPDFKRFLQVEIVHSAYHRQSEDAFSFINRHTVGRPRDFVILANAISERQKNMNEDKLKDLVTTTAEQIILTNLYDESKQFLDCLYDQKDRFRFYELLKQNILTRKQLFEISCRFSGIEDSFETIRVKELPNHPFSELYKIGFLGTLHSAEGKQKQRFKQPSDEFDYKTVDIPDSKYYFIHPIISFYLHGMSHESHRIFKNIIVGHGYDWSNYSSRLFEIQSVSFGFDDDQLTGYLDRFLDQKFFELPNIKPEIRQSNEWLNLSKYLQSKSDFDKLHYLIDDLIDKEFT